MSQRKSERLLNLAIALKSARRYLLRSELREKIEDYRDLSDEAFGRMFERDKSELREVGLPIDVRSNSVLFDDEPGYRILCSEIELPALEFTPEELGALAVASHVWQQAGAADQTRAALAKLSAAGAVPVASSTNSDTTDGADATFVPFVAAREPAFEQLWTATARRIPATFTYRGGATERTVEPWRMTYRKAAWYLLAFDRLRQEPRTFKVSRIISEVTFAGQPGSYQMPSDVDLAAYSRSLERSGKPDAVALLAVRDGRAASLRRRGTPDAADVNNALPAGFSPVSVPYALHSGFVAEIAREGEDVIVLAPAELAAQVHAHLVGFVANLSERE
ncbi:MAG: WYL domain-containing protein [Propionibacteriaceae bacterium]|jgi:proteasome accessory factor B|nr:WYL domain-containing protein [Propionibacteriaceae bacterium]